VERSVQRKVMHLSVEAQRDTMILAAAERAIKNHSTAHLPPFKEMEMR
jgi:hypothetical protein